MTMPFARQEAQTTQASSTKDVQTILSLFGWVVALGVLLFTKGPDLPDLVNYVILGFIALAFLTALILGIVPAVSVIRQVAHHSWWGMRGIACD